MDNLRVFATIIIVLGIAILSIFQMQIRGYEKVGRMERWVLFVNEEETCDDVLELIYTDDINNYYLPCTSSETYIVKSGFEERELVYALNEGLISIEELDELLDINIVTK